MESELDQGIAVRPAGPGRYAADLAPGWVVGGGLNGGYLLAVLGNAIREELIDAGHVDPITLSAHFLRPTTPGPASIQVERVRSGGRRSNVAASLAQEEDGSAVERIRLLAAYGTLAEHPEVERQVAPPELPAREDCVPTSLAPEEMRVIAPLMERFDMRLDPACAGWAMGSPSGDGMIQAWFRLADQRDLDPIALLLAVDALPPVTFDLGRPGWAPTLELTAHVRKRPAPGWAIVRHETRNISGGYFEEDCHVWDSEGTMVAQSRQLALLPR